MAKVIITNQKNITIRPCTLDSNMFISHNGILYEGYYLKTNCHTAEKIIGIVEDPIPKEK